MLDSNISRVIDISFSDYSNEDLIAEAIQFNRDYHNASEGVMRSIAYYEKHKTLPNDLRNIIVKYCVNCNLD